MVRRRQANVLVGTLISLAVSLIANRIGGDVINALHPALLLGALVVIQVLGVLELALFANVWLALAAMSARDAARALSYPIQAAWLQRNVDSEARATVLSMSGQADALGQVLGGPPLGVLASRTSIPIALVLSAAILSPAALLYSGLRRRRETRVAGQA